MRKLKATTLGRLPYFVANNSLVPVGTLLQLPLEHGEEHCVIADRAMRDAMTKEPHVLQLAAAEAARARRSGPVGRVIDTSTVGFACSIALFAPLVPELLSRFAPFFGDVQIASATVGCAAATWAWTAHEVAARFRAPALGQAA